MIYISNNLYISNFNGGDDFDGNNPIIGYHSILEPSDIDVPSYTSIRPPVNMWTPDTALVWEGAAYSGPSTTLEVNILLNNPNAAPVNYVGIGRHNLGDFGWQYTIQSSTDGVVWIDRVAPLFVSKNDALMHYFDERTDLYFRINLQATGSEIPSPIIGHVKMGEALVLQRRMFDGYKPPTIAPKVRREALGSENGQYLGQIVTRKYYTASCMQENNTPEFVRANIVPFINHVNGDVVVNNTAPSTFFFAWRPSTYPDEIIYAWTMDQISPEIQTGDSYGGLMKWGFEMEAIA